MSLQDKYRSVLELGKKLNIQNGSVEEYEGLLKVGGIANTQYEKNLLWDEIKKVGGELPADIEADIKVNITDYFHKHTVVSGDTLGKISKKYYGKSGEYMAIFNANTDILKDPNMIHPGQELTIPFV